MDNVDNEIQKNEAVMDIKDSILYDSEITLEAIVEEITNDINMKDWKDFPWWMEIPKKEQFRPGDIVYISDELSKFGIFIEPTKKEGLVKIRLLKRRTKKDVYTRDWYINFDSVELVKRADKVSRGYVETDVEFIKRAD